MQQESSVAPIKVKRVYELPEDADGYRVLVDRVWPRGVSRERADVEEWLKTVAPSTELRRWFAHDPSRWDEFCRRYHAELDRGPPGLAELGRRARRSRVTLIYSARDEERNQAVALRAYLERRPGP